MKHWEKLKIMEEKYDNLHVEFKELKEELKYCRKVQRGRYSLAIRNELIFLMRHGIKKHSLEEIAAFMGISPSRAGQIDHHIRRMLKHPSRKQ